MKNIFPYVGSKRSLLKDLEPLFPDSINNYYEPFVGGGSVLFYLNENYNIQKNYINDLDTDVINVYKVLKNSSAKMISYLENINKLHSKKDFEKLVDIFNYDKKDKILLAAIYIYMCKRSFNSQLNIKNNIIRPYYAMAHSNNIIFDKENINEIEYILKNTIIKSKDYLTFLNEQKLKKGDFVFFDPPYLTIQTKYFYKNMFNITDYEKLKHICDKLNKKGVNFMLTTNKHSLLKKIFNEYNIKIVKKYSRISNGKITEYEMVITNY